MAVGADSEANFAGFGGGPPRKADPDDLREFAEDMGRINAVLGEAATSLAATAAALSVVAPVVSIPLAGFLLVSSAGLAGLRLAGTVIQMDAEGRAGTTDEQPDPGSSGDTVAPTGTATRPEFVQRLDDASLTFEALVQVFGEAVARIDDASRRLADVADRLLGPGGDAPEAPEPGFERALFRPSGVSGGAMALAPAGASAALMPVDESFADASRAVAGFVDDSEGVLGELGEFSERMFGELGDALGGVLETGELEWRDFARVAIDAIADILAEQAKLLFGDGDASGGGAGGLLGGLLSGVIGGIAGAFAHGGRPNVGMTALVGEAGPELFIPDVPGTIIPHGAFGGFAGADADAAPTVITNFTIDARGAERGVERRIAEAMAQAEQRISQNVMAHILNNARRGGAFARMSRR